MSKEKTEVKTEVKKETVKKEQYHLTDGVLLKWTGVTFLEDLTDKQLWQLAIAKVITLSKEQEKVFKEKFYK